MNLVLLLVTIFAPLAPLGIGAPAEGKQERQPDHESAPAPGLDAQADPYLYEVILLRAAPGRLLELVEAYQARIAAFEGAALGEVHMMRHSQGDQWDLMVLFPMGGFEEYYSPAAVEARESAFRGSGVPEADFESELTAHVAWREDWFVRGPAPGALGARFDGTSFFHIEIFLALHDKRGELLEQRRMENDYLERIGRQQNVILTRAAGAPWDMFTLGFYRDIKQYAESADIAEEVEERAARAAGFEGAGSIGSYLRSLIAAHHDTLAVAVR